MDLGDAVEVVVDVAAEIVEAGTNSRRRRWRVVTWLLIAAILCGVLYAGIKLLT